MGKRFLIDSNTIIDYLSEKLPASGLEFIDAIVDDVILLSVVSKIEVLGFNTDATAYRLLSDFIDSASLFNLTDSIVDKTIELRKVHRIKLPDAIIAATAIVHDLTLLTRNKKDFQHIEELSVVSPWE